MSWLKKRLPKKRWKRVCIYILSGFVILLAADMLLVQYWRHVTISPETTRITSPLKADGQPDYVAARNAECSNGVTPENNAAPALLKIVGTDQFPRAWREQVLPHVGLSPAGTPKVFVDYFDWLKTHAPATSPGTAPVVDDDDRYAALRKPWKSGAHADDLVWLNAQHESVGLLHDALKKDRFYLPWISASPAAVVDAVMPWLSGARKASDLLLMDGMHAAGDGDFNTFREDVLDEAKLSRLMTQGSTLLDYLVGLAIETNGSVAVQDGASRAFLQAKDARSLLQAWESLAAFPDESRVLDKGERFFCLNAFGQGSLHSLRVAMGDTSPPKPMENLMVPIHYNAALRTFNHYFDELIAAQRLSTYKQRDAAMKAVDAESAARRNFLDIAEALVRVIAPSLGRTVILQERSFVNHDLATVALALRIYREEHGTFPASLGELSPGILSAVPVDGFIDAPFHYRREEKGYVLYSVNDDGKDDGGRDRKAAGDGKTWDISVRAVE
jgi:hypothetical protein